MIKGLRVFFTPKEKTAKNIKKFLEIVGDDSWSDDQIRGHANSPYYREFILTYVENKGYRVSVHGGLDYTEVLYADFIKKYEDEENETD